MVVCGGACRDAFLASPEGCASPVAQIADELARGRRSEHIGRDLGLSAAQVTALAWRYDLHRDRRLSTCFTCGRATPTQEAMVCSEACRDAFLALPDCPLPYPAGFVEKIIAYTAQGRAQSWIAERLHVTKSTIVGIRKRYRIPVPVGAPTLPPRQRGDGAPARPQRLSPNEALRPPPAEPGCDWPLRCDAPRAARGPYCVEHAGLLARHRAAERPERRARA